MLADLNAPGHYVQWSIFTISVANLIFVAIMLVIFLAAIVLPFGVRSIPRFIPVHRLIWKDPKTYRGE